MLRLVFLFTFSAHAAFAESRQVSAFDQIKAFSDYLRTSAPDWTLPDSLFADEAPKDIATTPHSQASHSRVSTFSRFQFEIEVGGSLHANQQAAAPNTTSGFNLSSLGTVDPTLRAMLGIFINAQNSIQFRATSLQHSGFFTPTSALSFKSTTYAANQTIGLHGKIFSGRVAFIHDFMVHDFKAGDRFKFGAGVGVNQIDHNMILSQAGVDSGQSSNKVMPLFLVRMSYLWTESLFTDADFEGFVFSKDREQIDASLGAGILFGCMAVRIGTRWYKSAIDDSSFSSKFSNQVAFASVRLGIL